VVVPLEEVAAFGSDFDTDTAFVIRGDRSRREATGYQPDELDRSCEGQLVGAAIIALIASMSRPAFTLRLRPEPPT
jgi:hypothetical protein